MQALVLIVSFVFSSLPLIAGDNTVLWQHIVGGTGDDKFSASTFDLEGNLILVGSVQNTAFNPVHSDILIVKLSSSGNILWEKRIGGTGDDTGSHVIALQDGSLLISGSSTSNDGIFSFNRGLSDACIIKLDSNGKVLQTSTFGGSSIDFAHASIELSNGNILLGTTSRSNDWILVGETQQFDLVLLELNKHLEIVTSKVIGGPDDESLVKLAAAENGQIIVLGSSTSYIDEYSDNRGESDIVVFSLDPSLEINWQRSFGGSRSEMPEDLVVLTNNKYLIAGSSFSADYDIENHIGAKDGWLFELDANGNMTWETSFGGDLNDEINAIKINEDNTISVLGTSSRYQEGSQQVPDFWFFQLDAESKEIVNQHYFGTHGFEEASSLQLTSDGTIVMCGNTRSIDHSQKDGWVLAVRINEKPNNTILAHPNPSNGIVYLNNCPDDLEVSISNLSGQQFELSPNYFPGVQIFDFSALPSGVYLLNTVSSAGKQCIRIVKT